MRARRATRSVTMSLRRVSVLTRVSLGIVLHGLVTSAPGIGVAQHLAVTPGQQKAIDAYVAERERVLASRGSLEALLAAAHRVNDVFTPPPPGDPSLDELPKPEIERIARLLPGLDVHIGDTVGVLLDEEYFLGLAKSHGQSVDVEFFALYERTYSRPSVWAAWMEPTGPETACTDFTSGELVDVFAAWRRFQNSYPGRYAQAVAKELEYAADSLLAQGRALCQQDMRVVRRELERLLASSPQDPLAPGIRKRLGDLPR